MIHLVFHFCAISTIKHFKSLCLESLQTIVLYFGLLCFFPFLLGSGSHLLSTLSFPLSCLILLLVVILSSSSFPQLTKNTHTIFLSFFANRKSSLYGCVTSDWIFVESCLLAGMLILSLLFSFPMGFLFLQAELNAHSFLMMGFLPFWIWNQLSLHLLALSLFHSFPKSSTFSCLFSLPLSIPAFLFLKESFAHVSIGLSPLLAFLSFFLLFLFHLLFTPPLISHLIVKTS